MYPTKKEGCLKVHNIVERKPKSRVCIIINVLFGTPKIIKLSTAKKRTVQTNLNMYMLLRPICWHGVINESLAIDQLVKKIPFLTKFT